MQRLLKIAGDLDPAAYFLKTILNTVDIRLEEYNVYKTRFAVIKNGWIVLRRFADHGMEDVAIRWLDFPFKTPIFKKIQEANEGILSKNLEVIPARIKPWNVPNLGEFQLIYNFEVNHDVGLAINYFVDHKSQIRIENFGKLGVLLTGKSRFLNVHGFAGFVNQKRVYHFDSYTGFVPAPVFGRLVSMGLTEIQIFDKDYMQVIIQQDPVYKFKAIIVTSKDKKEEVRLNLSGYRGWVEVSSWIPYWRKLTNSEHIELLWSDFQQNDISGYVTLRIKDLPSMKVYLSNENYEFDNDQFMVSGKLHAQYKDSGVVLYPFPLKAILGSLRFRQFPSFSLLLNGFPNDQISYTIIV